MTNRNVNVLVLDMQPIDPPVGGGRLRLLGLYHNLGEHLPTQYIGTFDWPGEKFRDHYLSDTLREVDVPLSDKHFAECRKWQERVSGKTIIDTTFHQLAHLSTRYIEYVRNQIASADVVIFSHPWVYPLVKDVLNRDVQTVIYDSQNVEGFLRYTLLDDGGFGSEIVREVVRIEFELCHFADSILTCSYEDRELFNKLYNVPFHKMKIVPNGVFTEQINPVNDDEKKKIKKQLGLGEHQAAIFIGSNYAPNLEACDFIIKEIAPNLPEINFIIAGGVGNGINRNSLDNIKNVKITGFLTEQEKLLYLTASDIAINPMLSGSGTNIKMFDFMAVGLPVISTVIGSRGIADSDDAGIIVCDRFGFISSINDVINNEQKRRYLGETNRKLVEKNYSWERISPKLGTFLTKKVVSRNVEYSPVNNIEENRRFALMSSWNLRCGIAEHSRYLVNEFEAKNVDFRIIANSNCEVTSSYFIDDISRDIYPLWKYDYLRWTDTTIDIAGILKALQQDGVSKFNIQYHPGFYNQEMLMELVRACVSADIEVSVSLHNSREVYLNILKKLNKMSVKIIVHSLDEKKQLEDQRIQNVFHIPLGVLDFPDEEKSDCRIKLGISGNPVIASFGFLRPHKGVLEAIDAVGILKDQYPNIKFLGVNALYPSEDSEQYYKLCEERINDLKLNDNVVLLTSFFEMDQIIHYLHTSDLIVLPYHDSKEGSSAAANMAIASKRPLVISNSGIFSAIKSVSYLMENIDPPTIASELQKLLSNPELLDKMKNKVVNYVNENSYIKIADKYTNILFGKRKMDYESILQRVYESFLESGDVAIDVGAHVGRHTIPIAKKISPDGRVYAVEPLPMGQKSLQNLLNSEFQNLSANIKLYPYALSDYEEESEFTFVVNNPGYSGLKEREFDNNAKLKKIKVPVKKLDNVFSDLNALRYIKIDAEGGEFNILKGGINTIKRFRPVVTFEFGASSYAAYSVIPEQVFLFWRELNYDVFDILGNKLENENIFAQSSIDQNVWDYIAIPVENKTITENFLRGAHKYLTPHLINNYSKQEGLLDDLMTTNIQISMEDLITFMADQLQFSQVNLPTKIPDEVYSHLSSAMKITEEVNKIIGDNTHGSYFESSIERYNHYFAIAETFITKGAHILDIGNAPGHVGIGLHLLGMKIQGLNLNDLWLDTYPSSEWAKKFNVISHDIEKGILPFDDNLFDAIYFTEVLEHIAIKNPASIFPEFLRVLKPGGVFILSTPNICNVSNIYSLMNGQNIFWPSDMFYGSFDRHNREYTPQEVNDVVEIAGFKNINMYGFNCYSNWRGGGNEFAIKTINLLGDNNPLLRNTIMLYAFK